MIFSVIAMVTILLRRVEPFVQCWYRVVLEQTCEMYSFIWTSGLGRDVI